MIVSFSRLHKYETCGAAYFYQYVRRLSPDKVSANLVFGKALHKGITDYIAGHAVGNAVNPVLIFEREWARLLSNTIVEFSATQTPVAFHATGVFLASQFQGFWEQSGLTALIDPKGESMVEQKLTMQAAPGVELLGYLDLLALTADGEIANIDLKTTLVPASEHMLLLGEQLTDYQMLAEANASRLGIEKVDKVGYIDLLKRKVPKGNRGKGPEIIGPSLVPARSEEMQRERRAKIGYLATQIKKSVFFRNPGMAYNSPCSMCEFRNLCMYGSMDGLVEPVKAQQSLA